MARDHGGSVVQAVVAVAERLYGSTEDPPDAVEWLLDEEFAFGEPYGTADEFLGDLAGAVAHQGTCTDTTVETVPFLIELVRDDDIAPGSRLILLCDLVRLGASGPPTAAVALADRITALGGVRDESAADHLTRQAIRKGMPRLLSRWGDECDAVRFALAALAALRGTHDRHVHSWPAALPARLTAPAPTPCRSWQHCSATTGKGGTRAGPAGRLAARRRREGRRPERGPRASGTGRPAGPRPRRGVARTFHGEQPPETPRSRPINQIGRDLVNSS
ncbi:hypothetical protein [Streptomyces cyaneofuscatus]|uniref:hypothetical protein n=1 Tax=Streptomyces cyaneofuscatus TaxID=66883 RepID=UPI0037B24F65